MKLINKLDLNGQIFLNSALADFETGSKVVEYALPGKSGILALKSDITDQHAFRFIGSATSINSDDTLLTFTTAQRDAAITASNGVLKTTDFTASGDNWTLAPNVKSGAINGYVFQVSGKEYASDGTATWVELGLNIDLADLVTEDEWTERIAHYYTKDDANKLFATKADVEANEEVVAQALNDHEGRLVAAETKLRTVEEGAEVNVQADWNVTDNTSDAYIANKPTNLAATYLATVNTNVASFTIAESTHHCGTYPMVQVYYGYTLVNADVVVDQTDNGDVTVSWSSDINPSTTPIKIRIVGAYSLPA